MIKTPWILAGLLALAALHPAPARAEDAPKPICADRPSKGTSPCTDDAGHWQVEVDEFDVTRNRSGGVTTDTTVFASTNFKYGVTDRLDLEFNITPLQTQSVSNGGGRTSGFGDVTARAKFALIPGDNAISLLPSLKLPTAGAGLGNGAVEGGLTVPISLALPGKVTLTLDPEVDALKDSTGSGRHASYALAVGASRALTSTVTGSVELWGGQDQDPGGHVTQASFDLGLAWIPAKMQTLQLDGGVNVGLNHATPGAEVYVGISRRF